MKRVFFALLTMFTTLGFFTSCEDKEDLVIRFESLPVAAQTTIDTYFDTADILLITHDSSIGDKDYVVTFTDGTVIDFDKNGTWESIESIVSGVPVEIIPAAIAEFINSKFPGKLVTEIEKETKGYEVMIDNLIELHFNQAGELIGSDVD